MLIAHFVEGWTSPIEYQLYHRDPQTGVEATFNATGFGAAIVLKNRLGVAVDVSGDVTWAAEATSKIRYTPDAADLVAADGPYTVHFKVTDGGGAISYYPQDDPLRWIVHPQ